MMDKADVCDAIAWRFITLLSDALAKVLSPGGLVRTSLVPSRSGVREKSTRKTVPPFESVTVTREFVFTSVRRGTFSVHSTPSGTIKSGHSTRLSWARDADKPATFEGRWEGRGMVGTARTDGCKEAVGLRALRTTEARVTEARAVLAGSSLLLLVLGLGSRKITKDTTSAATAISGNAILAQSSAFSVRTTESDSAKVPSSKRPLLAVAFCCSKLLGRTALHIPLQDSSNSGTTPASPCFAARLSIRSIAIIV
mmetsp:Transcript_69896/g.166821  ORF Transcript_69896/g.166821 Transcript_69896/m.166821 type:complete len:254 (-) Transcript_69896:110-871(-)